MKIKLAVVIAFIALCNVLAGYYLNNIYSMSAIMLVITTVGFIALYMWLLKPIQDMQKKLKIMEEENRQLEAMRKEFVANVTHELKTPLTSIIGFIETLQDGAADDPEIRNKFIDIIAIETARLKRLIEDTLVLSDIESKDVPNRDKINVKATVQGIITVIEPIAYSNKVTIFSDVDANIFIWGNEDRFRQMLVNIVENAVKYSNEGGRVWITGRLLYGKLVITVRDEGIGISEENLGRLFERFYRVDKSRSRKVGGTGLGLSIVKHIAALLNADIKVDSKLGEGTTFTISFQ